MGPVGLPVRDTREINSLNIGNTFCYLTQHLREITTGIIYHRNAMAGPSPCLCCIETK